jgi:hypothetical protein
MPVVLGLLAAVTAVPAWWVGPERALGPGDLTGQLLNRNGKEVSAEQIAELRVVTWDDAAGAAKVFEVKKAGGSWTIPSHYDYPADGGSRVGKTSGGVRNVARGRLATNDANRHEEFGVVDPLLEDATKKGRGKRVVLKDATGGVLVDLIVGARVSEGDGMFFVRDANDSAVYAAKLDADISTRFADWVETDLLKVKAEDVRQLVISDYSVNEQQGTVDERAVTVLKRKDGSSDWESPGLAADKKVAKETVDKIMTQVTGLKLAGVRRFNLNWLGQTGFFPVPNPALIARPNSLVVKLAGKDYALFGNEGRMDITTKDGLRYSLVFGEISLEDEDKPSAEADKAKKLAKDVKDGGGHQRYMSVYVAYDPALDEDAQKEAADKAKKAAEAKPDDKKPADEAPKTPPGKARAEKAQARFGRFFYVISDESFKALRPAGDKLFEAKPAEPPKPADGAAKPADGAPAPPAALAAPAAPAAEAKPVEPAPAPAPAK